MSDNKEILKIQQEALEIIDNCRKSLEKNYLSIRDAYNNHYDWTELDPLRHEITLSLSLGLNQAAITLTNHLLESALKNFLIAFHSREAKAANTEGGIAGIIAATRPAIEKFGSMNLYSTIQHTFKADLISEEDRQLLHSFREDMRNAYGHADKKKTFRGAQTSVQAMSFEDDGIEVENPTTVEIEEFLIGQGIFQATLAEQDAPKYFLEIDRIIRELMEKVFPGYLAEEAAQTYSDR